MKAHPIPTNIKPVIVNKYEDSNYRKPTGPTIIAPRIEKQQPITTVYSLVILFIMKLL
jgi:hypothetical protein